MLKKIIKIMSRTAHKVLVFSYRKNTFYTQAFGDGSRINKQLKFDLDIINTGSNSAYFGIDYSGSNIHGANLAMRPQSLNQDLNMLKMFESYLKPKGTILVSLCPFSSCYKTYKNVDLERYYTLWHPALIENFDINKCEELWQIKNNPLKYKPKDMLKGYIRFIVRKLLGKKDMFDMSKQPMSAEQLEQDAQRWIDGWKKQFNIQDLEAPLTEHVLEGRQKRIETLKEIVSFCKDREFNLVLVIPPVTKYLSSKITPKFRELYINSFLTEAGAENIPFLNYLDDEELQNPKYYFNSFFLNKWGRKVFTERVIRHLKMGDAIIL